MKKAPINMKNPPMAGSGQMWSGRPLLRIHQLFALATLAGHFFSTIGDRLFP